MGFNCSSRPTSAPPAAIITDGPFVSTDPLSSYVSSPFPSATTARGCVGFRGSVGV